MKTLITFLRIFTGNMTLFFDNDDAVIHSLLIARAMYFLCLALCSSFAHFLIYSLFLLWSKWVIFLLKVLSFLFIILRQQQAAQSNSGNCASFAHPVKKSMFTFRQVTCYFTLVTHWYKIVRIPYNFLQCFCLSMNRR